MIWLVINPITYITEVNELQQGAKRAYQNKNYYKAIRYYETLINDLQVEQEGVFLNLAHAYFKLKDIDKASFFYNKALHGKDPILQSAALNQLGYIAMISREYEESLKFFQNALLKNSQNENARFNLELLLKKIKSGQLQIIAKQNPQNQENNSLKNTASKKEKSTAEQLPSELNQQEMNAQISQNEREGLQSRKLEEIKLNREKAEAILEALRNQEIQYIQQLPQQKDKKSTYKAQNPHW